jgi:putative membrane protein
MYHDGYYAHHSGPGVFAWLFMIVLILLLVALAVLAVRYLTQQQRHPLTQQVRHDEPLDVLRMRYARGEVDRESFLAAHADLGGVPPPA